MRLYLHGNYANSQQLSFKKNANNSLSFPAAGYITSHVFNWKILTHIIQAVNSHVPVPIVIYWILSSDIPASLNTYDA